MFKASYEYLEVEVMNQSKSEDVLPIQFNQSASYKDFVMNE